MWEHGITKGDRDECRGRSQGKESFRQWSCVNDRPVIIMMRSNVVEWERLPSR